MEAGLAAHALAFDEAAVASSESGATALRCHPEGAGELGAVARPRAATRTRIKNAQRERAEDAGWDRSSRVGERGGRPEAGGRGRPRSRSRGRARPPGRRRSSNSTVVAASPSSTGHQRMRSSSFSSTRSHHARARIGLARLSRRRRPPRAPARPRGRAIVRLARVGQPAPGLVTLGPEARSPVSRSPCSHLHTQPLSCTNMQP